MLCSVAMLEAVDLERKAAAVTAQSVGGDVPLGFYAEKRQDSFAVIVEVKHCGVLV